MLPTRTNTLRSTKSLRPQTGRLTLATLLLLGIAAAPAVHAQGYTLKTLASFSGANGLSPLAGLAISGSTLYGTTYQGGANGYGEVFSVPITGGAPTTLASFSIASGVNPSGSLAISGGMIYGTTPAAGAHGYGTVFSVPATGGALTTLTDFTGGKGNGGVSYTGLTVSGNTLYGTAQGGTNGAYGEVFSLPTTGGAPTVLMSFPYSAGVAPYGITPNSGLLLSGGTLYGVTETGGPQYGGVGTVYSLPVTGGSPTVLAAFTGTTAPMPYGNLTLGGNTLYGTTRKGGASGNGTVFSVPVTGGKPTTLAEFSGPNGSSPTGGLVLVGGTLFGTTTTGGPFDTGEVFSVPVAGGTPTVLAQFNQNKGYQFGIYPEGNLIYSNGVFYGTTSQAGNGADGTVFALVPNGAPVPEASSWVSFGLLLVGGLGAMVLRARRRSAA